VSTVASTPSMAPTPSPDRLPALTLPLLPAPASAPMMLQSATTFGGPSLPALTPLPPRWPSWDDDRAHDA